MWALPLRHVYLKKHQPPPRRLDNIRLHVPIRVIWAIGLPESKVWKNMGAHRSLLAGFVGAFAFSLALCADLQPVLAQSAPAGAAEITFWQSVRDTRSPIELEAYLAAYPDGNFAPLAKIRLKALRKARAQKTTAAEKPPVATPAPAPAAAAAAKVVEYRFGESGWLGAMIANSLLTGETGQIASQSSGVRIVRVLSDSPALKSGLRKNDIILAIGGKLQTDINKFIGDISALTPGTTVTMSILRDGERVEIPITIGGRFTDSLIRAQAGDPVAQVTVGRAYAQGSVVEKDLAQARRWYEKAALQGNRDAQNSLGYMYWFGRSVPEDKFQGFEWFLRAAEQGHFDAQTKVGYAYANGLGVSRNDRKAVEWYRKAVAQSEPYALNNLALLHEAGRGGLRKNRGKAIELFRRAAGLGNQLAIDNLKQRNVAPYDLAEIQRLLAGLGYAPGPADAKMGRKTRAAIRAFQADTGMLANGMATLTLAARLREAKNRARPAAVAEPSAPAARPAGVQRDAPTATKVPAGDMRDLDTLD